MKKLIVFAALALLASPALADDEGKARETLERFLHDPLVDEKKTDGIVHDDTYGMGGAGFTFVRRGTFIARVDTATDTVTQLSRFEPVLWIAPTDERGNARSPEERRAEADRRAHFTLDEDEKRARAFVAAHGRDFEERVFRLEQKERSDNGSYFDDRFTFVEHPRTGVRACWPNRIVVRLDPETGTVTLFDARDHRVESNEEPVLTKREARAIVSKAFPDDVVVKTWATRKPVFSLVGIERAGGTGSAWAVDDFAVDAKTGAIVLAPRSK